MEEFIQTYGTLILVGQPDLTHTPQAPPRVAQQGGLL